MDILSSILDKICDLKAVYRKDSAGIILSLSFIIEALRSKLRRSFDS